VIVPKGGPFVFAYSQAAGSTPTSEPRAILNELIRAYDVVGYGGAFEVKEDGGLYHIVPRSLRDQHGVAVKHSSILDTCISLPLRDRTLYETVVDVLRAVSSVAGVQIWSGLFPQNLFLQAKVRVGGSDRPARDLLLEAFAASKRALSWQIFYGSGSRPYAFNVHVVTQVP